MRSLFFAVICIVAACGMPAWAQECPHERAWMDTLFDEVGYVDAFRVVNQLPDQYTWWSNRGQAWANNTGWRIDYQVITPKLAPLVKATSIYKDERFSDHSPLIIDYDYELS